MTGLRALAFAVGAATLAPQAVAQGSGTGADLVFNCNANGAKVTEPSGEVFYFGKDWDSITPGRGCAGRWRFSASGLAVEIGESTILYRVKLPCDPLPYCQAPDGSRQ